MPGVKTRPKQLRLSKDIYLFKKRFHLSIIIIDKGFPGFPCKFRIRRPKKYEPWFDVTINNRMFSIGWL